MKGVEVCSVSLLFGTLLVASTDSLCIAQYYNAVLIKDAKAGLIAWFILNGPLHLQVHENCAKITDDCKHQPFCNM
jgi:hypothetical protein